jgi:hypothetical protein
MGRESRSWQAREEVLSYFGRREGVAKRRYQQFVFEGIKLGKRGELGTGKKGTDIGGGREDGLREGDSRILGGGGFVQEVLAGSERRVREREWLIRKHVNIDGVLDFIGGAFGVKREEILGGGRRREISKARSLFCYVCLKELGLTGRRLSEALGVTPAGVHLASVRGEAFVMQDGRFEESLRSYLNNLSTSP